ncbi:response regulator receiver protein [Thalassoporum mexicanum PCC 7367]|uniref:response regulator n=1 Tax=Thalassoporum mexicanum TaxID=3457544 RepID=UPI00029F88FE|nr:response regulator [Pseudanabaena sp. PCC 7367]AFY71088.1 response regulator receiver protein [Pseudanabaena sp. PCC 7367]
MTEKILVIDDSIMIRKMVKNILAGKYEVLEANDGKSGLEVARRTIPDLVLLDFVMPKYNGYQTLKAIRRFDDLREIPIIMISGLKEQVAEHVPEPFEEFDFLEKPFEADVLLSRIQKLLQSEKALGHAPELDHAPEPAAMEPTAKLSAGETFLIQGMENLIQREVVARMAQLTKRSEKQDVVIANMEKRLDKISQQIDHQNKGIMVLLREIKAIQNRLPGGNK